MTIAQRKQLAHRRIARAFASDMARDRDDEKAVRTFGLFAGVLSVLVFLSVLWGLGLL